eukprot:355830-Pelagomonas_calceolata.AAC.1
MLPASTIDQPIKAYSTIWHLKAVQQARDEATSLIPGSLPEVIKHTVYKVFSHSAGRSLVCVLLQLLAVQCLLEITKPFQSARAAIHPGHTAQEAQDLK